MKYPDCIVTLIHALRRLPGVGNKTAERYAFHLIDWQQHHLAELARSVDKLKVEIKYCAECGCLIAIKGCEFCGDHRRDQSVICVVSTIREVFAIEQMGEYKGLYHVLGGVLSPMDGVTPELLHLEGLLSRVVDLSVKEVIIALDSTLEGDATALYLKKLLEKMDVTVTRLAFGIPMGSSLDYIDGGTLAYAMSGRTKL